MKKPNRNNSNIDTLKSMLANFPQGLESGTHRIWTQHLKSYIKPLKNVIYYEMQRYLKNFPGQSGSIVLF